MKSLYLILFFCLFFVVNIVSAQSISGKIFNDTNGNGVLDGMEVGFPGMTINAYDANGAAVATTVSQSTSPVGNYTLTGLSTGASYRVEFVLPFGLSSSPKGSASNTSVQFALGGATNLHFGVYDQGGNVNDSDPLMVVGCGLITGCCPLNSNTNDPSVASWLYLTDRVTSSNSGVTHPHNNDLRANQVGIPMGSEVRPGTMQLYFSTISSDFTVVFPNAPGGIGQIYVADYTGKSIAGYKPLVNVVTDLGISVSAQNPTDPSKLQQLGEQGLGGMTFSSDGKKLYVVNMGDGKIIEIDVSGVNYSMLPATKPTIAREITIPSGMLNCTNGTFRPSALSRRDGLLYMGGICDGVSGTKADVKGVVLSLKPAVDANPANDVWAPAFTLNTANFTVSVLHRNDGDGPWDQVPWDVFPVTTSKQDKLQPYFSDIAFDDAGNMFLGISNRLVAIPAWSFDQTGYIIRTIKEANGSYTLESNGVSGPYTSTARPIFEYDPNPTDPNYNFGPGNRNGGWGPGGKFFYEQAVAQHNQLFSGGMLILPGKNEIVAGFTDPLSVGAIGARYFDLTNGRTIAGIHLAGQKQTRITGVSAIFTLPPLEIGNRVWLDADQDGIQDAGEISMPNISLELFADFDNNGTPDGAALGTTMTSMDGTWYFNAGNVTDGDPTVAGSQPGPQPNKRYLIRIAAADWAGGVGTGDLLNYTLTVSNVGSGSQEDVRDSDAALPASAIPTISYLTGNAGDNDHTLDIGFTPPPCNITVTSATPSACSSATNTHSVDVVVTYSGQPTGNITVTTSNGGSVTVAQTSSPQTITITGLTSNGMIGIGVTAFFVVTPACTHTLAAAFNAPACCNLPLDICSANGDTYTLTAEAGFTGYQWYNNGAAIPNANSATYIASQPGIYTWTAVEAGCPVNGCCATTLVNNCQACTLPSAITFSQTAPTCSGGGQNDGSITLTAVTQGTHFGLSTRNAATYDGPLTTGTATVISALPQLIIATVPSAGGTYIVRIFNSTSSCYTDQTVTVAPAPCCTPPTGSFVAVPGNCTGITINNNGRIVLTQTMGSPDKYGVSAGATYTGPNFAAANGIGALPFDVKNNVVNAGATYTIRLFAGSNTCYSDYTIVVPPTNCPSDPMGYVYCEETGSIISGGTISVTGPSPVVITQNGSSGEYQFFTDGTSGIYTLTYTPPAGYMLSTTRLPGGTLDPTGHSNPFSLGSASTGGVFLDNSSAVANPYYVMFNLASGDPEILLNNIALKGCVPTVAVTNPCVCHDVEYDNINDPLELLDYIDVTDGPGKTWQITAQTGMETIDPSANIPLPVPSTLTYNAVLGVYRIYIAHTSGVGYTGTLSNGSTTLTISNLCTKNLPVYPVLPTPYCTNAAPTALPASQPNFTETYFIGSLSGTQITSFDPSLYVGQSSVDVLARYLPVNGIDCPMTVRTLVPLSNATPIATIPGTICNGATINLNTLVTGSIPPSTLSFYISQSDANADLNVLANTTVGPLTTTTYYVRNVANGGCTSFATLVVTVTPPPLLQVINGTVCAGESVNLNSLVTNAGNGTLSFYTTAPNALAGINALGSTTVSPASATNYYVRSAINSNNVICASVQEVTVTLAPATCNNATINGPN